MSDVSGRSDLLRDLTRWSEPRPPIAQFDPVTGVWPPEPTRHRFTLEDVFAMHRAGVLYEGGGQELIDGDLIDLPSSTAAKVETSSRLLRRLFATPGADELAIVAGGTLRLSDYDGPSPAFWIVPRAFRIGAVAGTDVSLLIELADGDLARFKCLKATLYARFGVSDYWVIDVAGRQVHVHRDPTPGGYATTPPPFGRNDPVEALLIPGLTLRLADLSRVGGAG